jgi:predicted nuclease with TOPRIM domain
MSIDERLEAIRHSVELLAGMQIETEKRLARLTERVDQLGEKVDQLTGKLDRLTENVDQLTDRSDVLQTSMTTIADSMALLSRIPLDHHDRIDRLEGNQPPQ